MSVQVIRAPAYQVPRGAVSAEMIRAVQDVFPTMDAELIAQDLSATLSVDQTINNILEGRLVTPVNDNHDHGPDTRPDTPVTAPIMTPVNPRPAMAPVTPQSRDVLTPPVNLPPSAPSATTTAPLMLPPQVKDKFVNSSQERHDRFQMRKQAMLKIARE